MLDRLIVNLNGLEAHLYNRCETISLCFEIFDQLFHVFQSEIFNIKMIIDNLKSNARSFDLYIDILDPKV